MTDQTWPRHWWSRDQLLSWEEFDLRRQATRLGLPADWLRERPSRDPDPPCPDCQEFPGSA
ncbi:hypothetical protein VSH64_11115 [Amycolatopsis rhabdoformis]|uniref:Uncharacterized protein n=1 Tax=Amycolatopsis rhabdoformis TaxID=1448059 RepID=A0ABZ1IE06_9PSEU|nr:hypothetical protein [Amycolatopsis rhabdoformis]WSE32652.1 hypothetical protein VSH64_11115 [Amycolatopsis rhabdoformis]